MHRTWHDRLTDGAFILTLALVIARATALETLRDPFEVSPLSQYVPRTLSAAAALWLDWLAFVPALLILARRWMDDSFEILRLRCLWPAIALAAWAMASVLWSNDQFAAVVGAAHFAGAVALLWAAAQLARDSTRYRIVAGVAFGLLLVLIANGLIYRYVELPDMQRSVERDWPTILEQRGWEPDSFTAQRFRLRVMAGEMVGFSASANTFAAMLVMTWLISAGVAVQRGMHRDKPEAAALILPPLLAGIALIYLSGSRAALATLLLGAACFSFIWIAREILARHHHKVFAVSLLAVLGTAGAVIGYGLAKNNLIHDSLTFRWRYWTGAARIVRDNPLLGVGWNNFGDRYLAVREAIASEEVKDPHSLPVRFIAELSVIGLLLAVAWLIWMWWDFTRPRDEAMARLEARAPPAGSHALKRLAWIAGAGMALNILASLDLSLIWTDFAWVFIELMKRGLYFGLLLGALVVVAFRSFDKQDLDDRPSPWIRTGMLIALGMFLLHNAIDFAFFESGPMWTFMLFAGATLGTNAGNPPRSASPRRGGLLFATGMVIWLAIAGAVAVPVTVAESSAHGADEAIRINDPNRAAKLLLDAYESLPFANSDYLYRAARAQVLARASADDVRRTLARAIAANPTSPAARGMLAQLEARDPSPDLSRVRAAFEDALKLDPNDVQLRLSYAETLERLGERAAALELYRAALEKNDQLAPDEPKRLPPKRVEEIRSRLTP